MKKKHRRPGWRLWLRSLKRSSQIRPFNPVEIAQSLSAAAADCRLPESELIEKLLPLFGLPASRHFLELYLSINKLPLYLKKALAHGRLLPEMLPLLARFSRADQKYLWLTAQKYRLSASRCRQLWQYLDEIRRRGARKKTSLRQILKPIGASLASARLSPQQKGEKLVELTRRIRFPFLAGLEARFAQVLRRLKLPPQLVLRPADNWEGSYSLTVRFQNLEQLRSLNEKVAEIAADQGLADFLQDL